LYENKIISINEENNQLKVKYDDKELTVFVFPEFDGLDSLKSLDKTNHFGIVVSNKKENLIFLEKNWDFFVEFKSLTIYFVNTQSKTEDIKWIINPKVHNFIAERDNLKAGLESLFSSVEEVV
jgi:hypothetical protein